MIPADSDGRLPALVDAVSCRGITTAIESPDWTDALLGLADTTSVVDVEPCLFGVGLQAECTVETGGQVIPRCELAADLPCYWLREDDDSCPGGIRFQLDQPAEGSGPAIVDIRCAGLCAQAAI